MSEKLERMTVLVPLEVKNDLKDLAASKGLTLSAYVRMILTEESKKK